MGTEIKTWQIIQGKLDSIDNALKNEGRTELYDLEPWLASSPEIIGPDFLIIGRQALTRPSPNGLQGIEKPGNRLGLSGIRRAK
jgi:hypothetical protein